MDESTGDLILKDFFKENKISVFDVNISSQTEAILESIISPQEIDEVAEADRIKTQLQRQDEMRKKRREEQDKKETIVRDIQKEDYQLKK